MALVTLHPEPQSWWPCTLNSSPQPLNPKPRTPHPKPQTPNQVVINRPLGARLSEVAGRGVFVEDVVPAGNAERAGLRVGDMVVDAKASPSASPAEVKRNGSRT